MNDREIPPSDDGSKNLFEESHGTPRTGSKRRVLVIHNPTAGWRRRLHLSQVLHHLAELGCSVTVRRTRAPGDAESLARAAKEAECDVVVAAGGDGTINEVANGLAGKPIPLAVIPLGTANVLAEEIGMPRSPRRVARVIAEAPPTPIHLGIANGRLFLLMAGVGFDAKVVAHVDPRFKRRFGRLAYVLVSLVGLFRFSRSEYHVTVDGETYRAASAIIANGRYYGGRFSCAPLARLTDPLLHVCLFQRSGPLRAMRYGLWLLLGRLDRLPDFRVVPGRRIKVEGANGEPVQADGDIIAQSPLKVVPASQAISMLMPG